MSTWKWDHDIVLDLWKHKKTGAVQEENRNARKEDIKETYLWCYVNPWSTHELTEQRWEVPVDTQELRVCGEKNNTSMHFPAGAALPGHQSSHDLQLSQGIPRAQDMVGTKNPQWCKRHWAWLEQKPLEAANYKPRCPGWGSPGLLLRQCSGAASGHTWSILLQALALDNCQWWDTRWHAILFQNSLPALFLCFLNRKYRFWREIFFVSKCKEVLNEKSKQLISECNFLKL